MLSKGVGAWFMALCPTNASSVQRVRVSPRRRLFQNLLKFSEPFFPGALCNSSLVRHLVASRKRSSVHLQQHRTYTQQWVTDQARSEKAVWACHSKSNLPIMKWLKGRFFYFLSPTTPQPGASAFVVLPLQDLMLQAWMRKPTKISLATPPSMAVSLVPF